MAIATDEAILERARTEDLVVVTLDADFHAILALKGASGPSVIRLRVQRLKGQEACQLIQSVLAKVGEEVDSGLLISASQKLVRIKRLPIRNSRATAA